MTEELDSQAEQLRALHHGDAPLVLPNVWDAASAVVVAEAGFPAIATGSAPIAQSLGYPDHEGAPIDEMFAAAGRIAGAVGVPVTADVEAGYGLSPAELVRRLLEAGAVGCNLEDSDHWAGGLVRAETQANRIAALRSAATAAGVNLVINARVDVFYQEWGEESERLPEAIRRGRLYLEAGADCVYPILVSDAETIGALAAEIPGPINVLFRPGTPSLAELAKLGVARVSYGPGILRATMAALRQIADTIADGGDPYAR
ncbi:MAG: isocitrate lyase/PEP mutase family protein [Micromonosporaceae bacterium]